MNNIQVVRKAKTCATLIDWIFDCYWLLAVIGWIHFHKWTSQFIYRLVKFSWGPRFKFSHPLSVDILIESNVFIAWKYWDGCGKNFFVLIKFVTPKTIQSLVGMKTSSVGREYVKLFSLTIPHPFLSQLYERVLRLLELARDYWNVQSTHGVQMLAHM